MYIDNSQQILDYLNSPINENAAAIKVQISDLNSINSEVKTLKSPNWQALIINRSFSSNTIQKDKLSQEKQSLKTWDQANEEIAKYITNNSIPDFDKVGKLNQITLGVENFAIRSQKIYGAGNAYIAAEYITAGIDNLFKRLNNTTYSDLTKSFMFYEGIVTLHPFLNGNGRTARLCADWLLIKSGYLPVSYTSPIKSHVAVQLNSKVKDRQKSYSNYLHAVHNSYNLVMGETLE